MTGKDQAGQSNGQQPEARPSLEDAARSGGVKRPEQGLEAMPATAPKRDSLNEQNETAAEILKAGVDHDPARKDSAIKRREGSRKP